MDYNKIWEIIEEWEELGFKPIKECISWLNGDERIEIYNEYNETDYSITDDGMDLILEEVETFDNAQEWIDRIIQWIGSYEATQLLEHIKELYDLI